MLYRQQTFQQLKNMKRDTRFKPGVSGNEVAKRKPGQSGNLSGKSRVRAQFEEAFNDALITADSPEEAAQLLWEAARCKEPWAIQELCRRFAPQTQSLQLNHEAEHGFDYSKLTDEPNATAPPPDRPLPVLMVIELFCSKELVIPPVATPRVTVGPVTPLVAGVPLAVSGELAMMSLILTSFVAWYPDRFASARKGLIHPPTTE